MYSKNKFIGILLFSFLTLGFIGCNSDKSRSKEKTAPEIIDPATLVGTETKMLLDYLNELGDYVNSRNFPSLIKSTSVYEGLGEKQLIIDIRSKEEFSKGHIEGAIKVDFSVLPQYFESDITPFEFEKIILVSSNGQSSSYATCLLRLMGYGNVYAMRWGMSAWNQDFAKTNWLQATGSLHQAKLVNEISEKAKAQKMPELNTGKSSGEEILLYRVNKLFSEGVEIAEISANDVFANSGSYYVMNYIRRDKYEAGHIAGAIRYKPQGTLGIVSAMSTISQDKESVVYCGTGHNSGFVTAYLRLFGYDAHTLTYGNNAFMHDKMLKEQASLSWLPFTSKEVKAYEYVK